MDMINVWLDDIRNPPEGEWQWAKSYEDAVELFQYDKVGSASLDCDLGLLLHPDDDDLRVYPCEGEAPNGEEFVRWIIENDAWPEISLAVHSANAWGAARMRDDIESYGPYDNRNEIDYGHAWGVIYTKENI
jgi:hypothetical protein